MEIVDEAIQGASNLIKRIALQARMWLFFLLVEPTKAHIRRLLRVRELHAIRLRPGLETAQLLAVLVAKNEAHRLLPLLAHYRSLGVDQFILIDNESTDSTVRDLEDAHDVSIYSARGSFKRARYGVDWVNTVLLRHGRGKWIVHVDCDEYLVFESVHHSLYDLCRSFDERGVTSMQSLLVDMYGPLPAERTHVLPEQHPLDVCPLFDSTGYRSSFDRAANVRWIKGGVRGRLFFGDRWDSPALNKTPVVRWRWYYIYLRVAHLAWPRRVNGGDSVPASALLHFKFVSTVAALMVDQDHRAQHTHEYAAYDDAPTTVFVGPLTQTYDSPRDLVRNKMIRSADQGADH